MSIYCSNHVFKYFEDYIHSINSILRYDIILHNGSDLITLCKNIAIFLQSSNYNIDFERSNKNVKIYIINTEQNSRLNSMNNYVNSFINFSNVCKKYFLHEPIWGDYNLSNIEILKDYTFPKQYIPYIRCNEEMNKLNNMLKSEKYYDIGIVDGLSNKRKKIVQGLKDEGYSVHICSGWKDPRDIEISKCRILINIHYEDDYQVFETMRCDRWIFSNMKVLSEKSLGSRNYEPNYMEVDYDKLVTSVKDFLSLKKEQYNYQNEIDYRRNLVESINI